MKSIRKFRLTRQTLKEAPVPPEGISASGEAPSRKEEEVDFPLGPRVFRKRRTPPEPEGHLIIIDRSSVRPSAEEETLVPEEEDEEEEEELSHQPIALDSGDLKIISKTEWEKLEIQGEPTRSSRPNGQAKGRVPANREDRRQIDAVDADGPDADTVEPLPVVIGPAEGPESARPAQVQGAEPEAPGKPAAREAPPSQNDAGVKEAAAERLSRYAMRVGTHSYVLIDDEGHLLKRTKPARQKKK